MLIQPAKPDKPEIPDTLFILPLKEIVVFPTMVVSVYVKNTDYIKQINEKHKNNELIGLVTYKNPDKSVPPVDNLYKIGTACRIVQIIKGQQNDAMILVDGVDRFEVNEFTKENPYIEAKIQTIKPTLEKSEEGDALALEIRQLLQTTASLGKPLPDEVIINLQNITDYEELCNLACSYITLPIPEKQFCLKFAIQE